MGAHPYVSIAKPVLKAVDPWEYGMICFASQHTHTADARIAKEELSAKPKAPDAWHSKEQSPGVDVSRV